MRSGWTLGRAFALTLVGLVVLLGALFYFLLQGWQESLIDSARKTSAKESENIAKQVEASLYLAEKVLNDIETRIQIGASRVEELAALESDLYAAVLNNAELSEVTFTRASLLGQDESRQPRVAPTEHWQLSVFRAAGEQDEAAVTRHTFAERGHFVSAVRKRSPQAGTTAGVFAPQGEATDPTEHLTFVTTVSSRFYGQAIWTDLHYSELDSHLPQPQRRVAVDVMKAVAGATGKFVGVLRVGLLTRKVDELIVAENQRNAPHRIFICDDLGRLIARGVAGDRLREEPDEELRIPSDGAATEITAALRHPALAEVRPGNLQASGELTTASGRHLVTFQGLGRTQGWRVGVVVPEAHYLGELVATRNRLLVTSAVVLIGALLVGGLTLRLLRRGLTQIVDAAQRMSGFDFAPSATRSPFRDVQEVIGSVELAKTALRAMSKYVPVDLVRHLYQTRREPVLGSEPVEVSLLFTDIEDFTRLSETLPPNELARLLGRYLEAMTRAVHGAEGVIDKYMGDALMAIWNAARPCAGHAVKACRAVLASQEAARALYASPEWQGHPPLVTRFGLNRDRVLVGHFGAPDRMSFTALGDGVNLASRLEGLNKHYGTHVLASEAIYEEAKGAFEFRLLDRVAVKGKTRGVRVYELLGPAGSVGERAAALRAYEAALAAYWARDFEGALTTLASHAQDRASLVLAERCRRFLREPPPDSWDGIYVASSK